MEYTIQIAGTEVVTDLINEFVAFLPNLLGALLILVVGWIVAVALGRLVATLADRVELDRAVLDTPLGDILGGTERAVSSAFGKITKWFVVAIAVLAAADVLQVSLLSEWIAVAVSYLPAFVAGLFIIIAGFVVADFIADAITRTRAATEVSYTDVFAGAVRVFLYFTVIVIGLSTMGIDVGILNTFARAFAWGLAAAVAIGVGIAVGWGGHDYVSANIDRWMGTARASASAATGSRDDSDVPSGATADGGTDED